MHMAATPPNFGWDRRERIYTNLQAHKLGVMRLIHTLTDALRRGCLLKQVLGSDSNQHSC
eukprot:1161720-Pelagomonas_calceolata.AAC.1